MSSIGIGYSGLAPATSTHDHYIACACGCGKRFQASRENQIYLNKAHGRKAVNKRRPSGTQRARMKADGGAAK